MMFEAVAEERDENFPEMLPPPTLPLGWSDARMNDKTPIALRYNHCRSAAVPSAGYFSQYL